MDTRDLGNVKREIENRRIHKLVKDLEELNRKLLDEELGILPQLLTEIRDMKAVVEKYGGNIVFEESGHVKNKRLRTPKIDYETRILRALDKGKLHFTDLLNATETTKPTLSKYLTKLEKEEKIKRRKVGRRVEYRIIKASCEPI